MSVEDDSGISPVGISATPTTSKVEQLTPQSRQINLTVKVVSKSPPREIESKRDGSSHRVSDALVGDETGCLYMTLWDDSIDKLNDGDTINVKNAYITLFRGSMRLNTGRYGGFEKSEPPLDTVNTENNLSNKQYEQERRYPSFRPYYQGEGGRDRRGGGGGRRRGGFRRNY